MIDIFYVLHFKWSIQELWCNFGQFRVWSNVHRNNIKEHDDLVLCTISETKKKIFFLVKQWMGIGVSLNWTITYKKNLKYSEQSMVSHFNIHKIAGLEILAHHAKLLTITTMWWCDWSW